MDETAILANAVQAIVCADGFTTRYLRAGHGPSTMVVLAARDEINRRLPRLPLVAQSRVFMPEIPSHQGATLPDASRWLRGFLDGVGLDRVTLVVDDAFVSLARRYATDEPDRVRDVLRLPEG